MVVNRNPEYFLMLVREKSFSRAAQKLYISQSSLSQHIAKLEEALQAALVDRSKSPIDLTEAGRIYHHYLESNNHLYQKLQSELDGCSAKRRQSVNIGLGTWRGSILLPEILSDFLQEHPHAQVNLHEYPVSELYSLVLNETVDFAVMNTLTLSVPEGFVNEVIAYERILLVMHRDDPVAQEIDRRQNAGKKVDLHLLEQHRLILLNQNQTVGNHVSKFLERNLLSFADRLYTTNNSTALNLVERQMGFCFLVESGLCDAQRRPDLVSFHLPFPDLLIPLSVLYQSGSYLSPLVLDLIDLIRDYYTDLIQKNHLLGFGPSVP